MREKESVELPPDVQAALVKRLGRFILDGAIRRAVERERQERERAAAKRGDET